jgi:hypothetical protein
VCITRIIPKICIALFGVVLFGNCTKKQTVEEYVSSINENNGYVQTFSNYKALVKCRYMPKNLMAIIESQNIADQQAKQQYFVSSRKKFNNSAYFTLTLSNSDGSNVLLNDVHNKVDYFNRLAFVTSEMSNFFYAVKENGDTVRTTIYDYQRSYGNSPDITMLFAFSSDQTIDNGEKTLQFYYKDQLLGIPQTIRFVFDNRSLKEDSVEIIF